MGKFESLIETADALIVGLDIEGRITLFNRRCQELTSYSEDEVLGRRLWDFLLPERFIEPVKRVFSSLREDRLPSRFENPWVTKEGEERYISWSNTNIKDEEGRIIEIFGVGIDITERVQAEEEIKRRNRDLAALYEIALATSATRGVNELLKLIYEEVSQLVSCDSFSIALVNKERGELRFEITMEEGKSLGKRTRKLDPEGSLAGWVVHSKKPFLVKDWEREKDTLPAVTHVVGKPVKSWLGIPLLHGGEAIGVMTVQSFAPDAFGMEEERLLTTFASQAAIAIENARLYEIVQQELDERKRAEEETRRLKEFNENIIRSVNEGILIEDAAGYVTFANPKMMEMLGRTEEELIGVHWTEVVPAKYVKVVSEELGKRSQDIASQYEAALLPKGGDELPVLISAQPLFSGDRYVGTLSVFTDITERKKAEEMKSEFVSTVSHELRTPLTSIKGYANLLLAGDAGELNDTQKEFLQVVVRNSDRLAELLNDFLDIERIESGERKLELRELELDEILRSVAETFRVNAEEKGLSFETEIEEGMKVEGDADYLTQACANLLSNAIKYTKEGSVRLRAKSERGRAIIEVEDSGIGMNEEELSQLFKRFFRADNRYVKEAGGTGLGLSIVKATIERHGGEISVESEPNGGSTFTVTLPLLKSWAELEELPR